MEESRTIFAQLMDLVPWYEFNKCVERYGGTVSPKKFSYRDQFLSMAFAQLTFRESLRDVEACLSALSGKAYHMGFRHKVARSTLAAANNMRDWRIWQDFGYVLIRRAKQLYANEQLEVDFEQAVYALDSTTISLSLSLFPWARYQSEQRAVKMHTVLDLHGNIPSFILISYGNMSDVKFLDHLIMEPGAMYIMDRGYFDFKRLYLFTSIGAYFVTRLKKNVLYRRTEVFYRSNTGNIRMDAAISPLNRKARRHYPQKLRLVVYYDCEQNRMFAFITNNFSIPAQAVADLYKSRWQVELFFKWLKQHIRIKAFYGTSENAVKSQIWTALAVYVLVAILKKELRLNQSLYQILQILSISSVTKIPILQAFFPFCAKEKPQNNPNQLELFSNQTGH